MNNHLSLNDVEKFTCSPQYNNYKKCDSNSSFTYNAVANFRAEPAVSSMNQPSIEAHHDEDKFYQLQIIEHTKNDIDCRKVSLLLKKMLQAPAGTDLSEIASPVSSEYSSTILNYR